MPLLDIPNEILLQIAKNIDARSTSAFGQTSRRLFPLCATLLLKHVISNETYSVRALYFAAANGDGNTIRTILQNIKSRFTYVNTRLLLDFSVPDNTPTQSNDEIDLICEFLATQRGASIIQDHNGWTALHWAAKNGEERMTRKLLAIGANNMINCVDNIGRTALHRVAENGPRAPGGVFFQGVLTILDVCEGGGEIRIAGGNHERVLQLLLDNGLDVNAVDQLGESALHQAVQERNAMMVEILLKAGANANVEDTNVLISGPLCRAIINGAHDIVIMLLENGANIDTPDGIGDTALHIMARYSDEAMAKILLTKGANTNTYNSLGETALHLAISRGEDGFGVAKLLLESRTDTEAKSTSSSTPLLYAASNDYQELAKISMEYEANSDSPEYLG